jgi:SAM-dependent methyltransferase
MDATRFGRKEAAAREAALRTILPPEILPLFDVSFIRSHLLYDEFVFRLLLQIARDIHLDEAAREPARVEELVRRAGLAPAVAPVPLDWMLRFLSAREVFEEIVDESGCRYRGRGPLPQLDPIAIREEQLRHDSSCRPAYVLAETVAREYPAFLRGEVIGEDVLFAPRRLRLWIDYFSNANGFYAVNNFLGAVAVERWLPRFGASILELGGGLGSGALALLEHLRKVEQLDAISDYRFTEFVPAFLRRGQQALRQAFPAFAGFSFGPLDMNRAFEEQGVAPGSVSVIFAVNTVHVAHDLDFTLEEVRRTLEPGGQLILSECVRPRPRQPIYTEFIFNLTETFRSPRLHPVYRPYGGFLTPEQWRAAIEAAGFTDVRFLPDIALVREQVPDFLVAAIGATRPA